MISNRKPWIIETHAVCIIYEVIEINIVVAGAVAIKSANIDS